MRKREKGSASEETSRSDAEGTAWMREGTSLFAVRSTEERLLENAGGRCSAVISVPSPHVAFQGDLLVTYNVTSLTLDRARGSPAFEIRLWDPLSSERELASRSVFASRAPEGTLVFPCGTVYHQGLHRITLTRPGDKIEIHRTSVFVRWPPATFRLPERVHAYENDLTVRVDIPEIRCGPIGRNLTTWLEVWDSTQPVDSTRTTVGNAFGDASTDVVVPCRILGPNDRFRVILWAESAEIGEKWKVASSSEVKVDLGPEFRFEINPYRDSVFPCSSAVAVRFQIPPCAGDKERIRLYGRRSAEPSRKEEYLEEVILTRRQGKAEFECWKFDETYVEYCLKYVNVDPLGRVRVLDTLCIPTFLPNRKSPRFVSFSVVEPRPPLPFCLLSRLLLCRSASSPASSSLDFFHILLCFLFESFDS